MVTTYKLSDPVSELGGILPGDALEKLKDMIQDPDADYGPGELARMGQALTEIGSMFLDSAKRTMEDRLAGGRGSSSRETQAGVMFDWRAPGEYKAINTKAVKEAFPASGFPEFYQDKSRKASINLSFADR